MSTFRLEPEHFHLTTGTFNLIVKDRIASRLSGAPSVRTNPAIDGNPYVLETFQSYRAGANAVNPLKPQDFHLFSTARGGSIHTLENADARDETRFRSPARFGTGRSGRL